jgi:hypothetical protein
MFLVEYKVLLFFLLLKSKWGHEDSRHVYFTYEFNKLESILKAET